MKNILTITFSLLFVLASCAQAPANRPAVNSEAFDNKIAKMINFTIPVMGVDDLKEMQEDVLILDDRPQSEFDVSHIEGAQRIGFRRIEKSILDGIDKNEPIVVYCSIGYRSEKVGEKLRKMGFKNVYNLYGSIFEWVNQGNQVVDKNNQPTEKVHTYNKRWSQWVEEGKAEKVW